MSNRRVLIAALGAVLLFAGVTAEAAESDQFVAGPTVRIDRPFSSRLMAFGGDILVAAPVSGKAILAGGSIRLASSVGGALYAAGGDLSLNGTVGGDARLAGGQLRIGKGAQITGDLSAAGGDVEIAGTVGGDLKAAGGRIVIDGPIAGDVDAATAHLELGPNARIGGRLRYASGDELLLDPAAQVQGGIDRASGGFTWDRDGDKAAPEAGGTLVAPGSRRHRHHDWFWTVGLIVIAAVLAAAWPNFYARVTGTVRRRLGGSLLVGLLALIGIPIVMVILLVTIIGIPLAVLVAAAYLVLLLAGYVLAAAATGDWALAQFQPAHAASLGWRVGAAMLGMLAIALLGRIPVLGHLIVFVALLIGIGALLLQFERKSIAA